MNTYYALGNEKKQTLFLQSNEKEALKKPLVQVWHILGKGTERRTERSPQERTQLEPEGEEEAPTLGRGNDVCVWGPERNPLCWIHRIRGRHQTSLVP